MIFFRERVGAKAFSSLLVASIVCSGFKLHLLQRVYPCIPACIPVANVSSILMDTSISIEETFATGVNLHSIVLPQPPTTKLIHRWR